MDQQTLTARQFGSMANNYLGSSVHATGADLQRLSALASQYSGCRALDAGCGAGHAAFALASAGCSEVVACDLSPGMTAVVREEATRRNLGGLRCLTCPVDKLPFDDASFDLIVTRYSAHHWLDASAGIRELARVLAPGGRLVVIDVIAPESPLLDTALQAIELLRDASHVRNYRRSEWHTLLGSAGLDILREESWRLDLAFEAWVERIGTPADRIAALHALFAALPGQARQYFSIRADLGFSIDAASFEAVRLTAS